MYSRTFALDSYFMHIPERLLDLGRTLVDGHDMPAVARNVKGLWTINWQNVDQGVETEVLIGRKNVNGYSCDCEFFKERKMCAHIAGALQFISVFVANEKQKKKVRASKNPRRTGKIHIKNVLDQLSEKELRQFILNQAAKNPMLAGELKVRYAYKLAFNNSEGKYYDLIRKYASALSPGKLTSQKFRKLNVYLEDLVDHAEDLSSEKNYREGFLIYLGLLRYLAIGSSSYHHLNWKEISLRIHQSLAKFFAEELPIQFKKEIIGRLRNLCEEESYQVLDAQFNLFTILFDQGNKERIGIYKELQQHARGASQNHEAQRAYWSAAVFFADYPVLQKLLEEHIQDLALLEKFFSIFTTEHKSLETKLARHALALSQGPRVQKWAFWRMVSSEHDQERRLEYFIERVLREGKAEHIKKLKEEAGRSWPRVLKELIKSIKKTGNLSLLFQVHVINENTTAAIGLVDQLEGTEMLLRYARFVWEADKNLFRCRLERDIVEHLEKYIGNQSAVYIIQVLKKLDGSGLRKERDYLLKMIYSNYSERKHLIKLLKDEF